MLGMRPRPLPSQLSARAFAVRDSGLPAKRHRAADLERSVHGARMAKRKKLDTRSRCELFAARMPRHNFFSHATAAVLLQVPLPLAVESDSRVHVSVAAPASSPHAKGLIGHRLALQPGDLVTLRGLRLTSPARTWCDLASLLELDDLIAAGDYLIHHDSPLTSRAEIERVLDRMPRARGIRRAREALPLLSDRPESPQESKLRLILLRSGLPEPEINYEMVDTETGKEVRPDFRFRRYKVILEYQGEYHRTKNQWRKDMTRRSRLEAQGWYVMELNADDLDDPTELVARIHRALARHGSR